MSKNDIEFGHASIDDLRHWMEERHRIYEKKERGDPPPWTDDPIMQEWKFTNVFRELDRGTKALRTMLPTTLDDPLYVLWNVIWYRLFNRHEHAIDVGPNFSADLVAKRIRELDARGVKVFTGAYMTVGIAGEAKIDTYIYALHTIYPRLENIRSYCHDLMGEVWFHVQEYPCIGPFVAYELVSDFRWYPCLWKTGKPIDKNLWTHIGPGAKRGLRRLGMPTTLGSMLDLLKAMLDFRPRLELRDVEHSLCEFDKYQRVKTGVGRPRSRYRAT